MEYAKIVVKSIDSKKVIANSVVMPACIANLMFMRNRLSESKEIMDQFSTTEVVPCTAEEFSAENFMLFLQFQNGEIDEEKYYTGLK